MPHTVIIYYSGYGHTLKQAAAVQHDAASVADASPEEGPLPGDLETARLFGQRLAETASHWDRQ